MASLFSLTHPGTDRPKNVANPNTNKLREEFRSTNWRFDMPTATIIPGKIYGTLHNSTVKHNTALCTPMHCALEQQMIILEIAINIHISGTQYVTTKFCHAQKIHYDRLELAARRGAVSNAIAVNGTLILVMDHKNRFVA